MSPGVRAILIVLAAATAANAQPRSAEEMAAKLFEQARDLIKEGRWADACAVFEASMRQQPAPGTRLNLANCYELIGKLGRAWDLYREAIAQATLAKDTKRRQHAEKRAAALAPRLARLVLVIPAVLPNGFTATRNGVQLDAAAWSGELYFEPGAHVFEASAPGFKAVEKIAELDAGVRTTVVLPQLVPTEPEQVTDPEDPTAKATAEAPAAGPAKRIEVRPPRAPSAQLSRRQLALGAGLIGTATAGIGLWFGAKSLSARDSARALCGGALRCAAEDFDLGRRLVRDSHAYATTSTVLLAIGGAAVVAGAISYFTAREAPTQRGTQVLPAIHGAGAGVVILGRL